MCFVAFQTLAVVMKVTDQVIPGSFRIIDPKKFALVGQKWIFLPHVIPPNVKLVDVYQYQYPVYLSKGGCRVEAIWKFLVGVF